MSDTMTIDQVADLLKDNAANASGVVLNGEFSRFCDLLALHCKGEPIALPWAASFVEIATRLEGAGLSQIPGDESQCLVARQIAALKQANGRPRTFTAVRDSVPT